MLNKLILVSIIIAVITLTAETFTFVTGWYPKETVMKEVPVPNPAVLEHAVIDIDTKQLNCLRKNIYFEARNQNIVGQIMVGIVTINRTKLIGFGNTICKVVNEKDQFSWTRSNKKLNLNNPEEIRAWEISGLIAYGLLSVSDYEAEQCFPPIAYYHTLKIKPPKWTKAMHKEFVMGDHIFYTAKL